MRRSSGPRTGLAGALTLSPWRAAGLTLGLAAAVVLTGLVRGAAAPPIAPKTLELGRGPTIVLVHGLGSSRSVWMPVARKLLGRYHVVMVDLPGHGGSPLPDPFSLEAAAEALDGVLARQKAESTIVVGHAAGGLVSLMAAAAHPEHLRGLVLIDVALKFPQQIPDQQRQMFLDYIDQSYDAFLAQLYTQMGRDSAQGVAIHAIAAQTPPVTIKAYMRELLGVDGNTALKRIKVPLRNVVTERLLPDGADWETQGKSLGWDAPESFPPRRIAKAGYLVMSDQPDTLAATISEFAAQTIAKK